MNKTFYEAKDIREILGIDKNKLFYWTRTLGLLEPDIEKASGTGTSNKYSLANLIDLAVIKNMVHFGLSLNAIRRRI